MIENMKQVDRDNHRNPVFTEFLSILTKFVIAGKVDHLCDIVLVMIENDESNIAETIQNHYPELEDKIEEFCEKHYWSKGIENADLESFFTSVFGAYWNSDYNYDNFDPEVMLKIANDENEHPSRRRTTKLIYQRIKHEGII